MTAALRPSLLSAAEQVDAHVKETVLAGRKAGPVKPKPKPVVTGVLTDLAEIAAASRLARWASTRRVPFRRC